MGRAHIHTIHCRLSNPSIPHQYQRYEKSLQAIVFELVVQNNKMTSDTTADLKINRKGVKEAWKNTGITRMRNSNRSRQVV
jgi:hypothetical protein